MLIMNIGQRLSVLGSTIWFVILCLLSACSFSPEKPAVKKKLITARLTPQTILQDGNNVEPKIHITTEMDECKGVNKEHEAYYHCIDREKNAEEALKRQEKIKLKQVKE